MMKIGLFQFGWWERSCEALSHEVVDLPTGEHSDGNAYTANFQGRLANGQRVVEILADRPVDLLLDNGATGLGFVRGAAGDGNIDLAHEAAGKTLCSHIVDPIPAIFQGLGWSTALASMQSESWVKAVWDRALADELRSFGVPNVIHLPMAAPDRPYNTEPLNPRNTKPIVSFVGGQNTTYFSPGRASNTKLLLPGTLAQAVRADLPDMTFHKIYHELYGLGEAVKSSDDLQIRVEKTHAYFDVKLFYHAALCIRNRDRFVIFLKRMRSESFHLAGSGWDTMYGLSTRPPFPTEEEYFNHFREAAINLNLVNGNAETGLNMRHFEIAAAGGFLMCYDQPEVAEHFDIGKECVVFHNETDLLDKIDYYLAHPEERIAIAYAGQQRTLSQHLLSHRLTTLLERFQDGKYLSESSQLPKEAPMVGRSESCAPDTFAVDVAPARC